jgi:fermentation-respiration switch protein FrsA (DUF1100 family)
MSAESTIQIVTPRGPVTAIVAAVPQAPGGVVMVGGAGGGMHGPSGVYADLSERLPRLGLAALRLDYRRPGVLNDCVADTLAGIDFLNGWHIARVALIGWSFGGAVVIRAGVLSPAVAGVATVSSQTFGAEGVGLLAPKRLLLIHGTADAVLPATSSRALFDRARDPKELVLFEGDGHGIESHRTQLLDTLYEWCKAVLLDEAPPPDQQAPSS